MDKDKIAIFVTNSEEWQSAVNWLKDKYKSYLIWTFDGQYPKYVYFQSNDNAINACGNVINYRKISFQEAKDIFAPNPYTKFEQARKEGKVIQCYSSINNRWYDILDKNYHLLMPANCYRIKVPYQHLLDAMAEGKTIQYKCKTNSEWNTWTDIENPKFGPYFEDQQDCYRIKLKEKVDPYKIFKDAIKAGKIVEFKGEYQTEWKNCAPYAFDAPVCFYRIKPEESKMVCKVAFEAHIYQSKLQEVFDKVKEMMPDLYSWSVNISNLNL